MIYMRSHYRFTGFINNFDRQTENKFLELLDDADPTSSERIRELMFTFEDLLKIKF